MPAKVAQQAGHYAKLSIIDSGCGMAPETLSKIFDPFFTTKEIGRGTDMGLSVVHGIVEQFGGFIHVDSTLGRGTTFNLYFRTVDEIESEAQEEKTATIPYSAARILVVDDEMQIAELNKELLAGCRTTRAEAKIRKFKT